MFHLRVPTTRALSIIGTGMSIRRPWYASTSQGVMGGAPFKEAYNTRKGQRFQPDVVLQEPGAILCRVGRSFFRFSHLELFAQRGEIKELQQLADYICLREFPHLVPEGFGPRSGHTPGPPQRYIDMFNEVVKGATNLVTEWLRVGYTQGNMNSDNTLLGGRTLDYGPYGWMEKFDPMYQPFTSDADGKFAFMQQPTAMSVNVRVLAKAFAVLVRHACDDPNSEKALRHVAEVDAIATKGFQAHFYEAFDDMRRRKLGLAQWLSSDDAMWNSLVKLMHRTGCDYTILFRELGKAAGASEPADALATIAISFYATSSSESNTLREVDDDDVDVDAILTEADREEWIQWLSSYIKRVKEEGRNADERLEEQNAANPKYVLRNWMSIMAYEKAAEGDYRVIEELTSLLTSPYTEQSAITDRKWYRKTPPWAQGMPGAAFMS